MIITQSTLSTECRLDRETRNSWEFRVCSVNLKYHDLTFGGFETEICTLRKKLSSPDSYETFKKKK